MKASMFGSARSRRAGSPAPNGLASPSLRVAALAVALFLLVAAPQASAQTRSDDRRALERIDSFRSFDEAGYSFDFSTQGSEGEGLMRVSVRLSGEEAALVRYLEPAKHRGRIVLVRGNSFWLLDSGMKKPLRISPRQLLLGQAAAGDITRISYALMYEIVGRTEARDGFVFDLAARKDAEATYDRVALRTDSSFRPIEAACRGRSGTLIKTIKYERYETVAGKELLTGFSIVDEASSEIERVRLSNFDRSVPPASAFAVQGLRFQE
jgi:hypothetical protein